MLRLWPPAPSRAGAFCLERLRIRKLRPRIGVQNGMRFPVEHLAETVFRIRRSEWDSFSGSVLNRKLCPGIMPQNGMRFPLAGRLESASQFERSFRDTLSARSAIRKVRPVLSVQPGTRFPLAWPLGKRGPDRGMRFGDAWPSSSYSSISLSHVGSAVCRMPAVCSFLASIPAERTSFMVKRSRG